MDNFVEIKTELNNILTIAIPDLEKRLLGAGAPYVR
jgi:hypothetical protein